MGVERPRARRGARGAVPAQKKQRTKAPAPFRADEMDDATLAAQLRVLQEEAKRRGAATAEADGQPPRPRRTACG